MPAKQLPTDYVNGELALVEDQSRLSNGDVKEANAEIKETLASDFDGSSVHDAKQDAEEVDLLIIGAGISGINMAYRAKTMLKSTSYVILERREQLGGTWDLMRYPGVRSDSDLYTFGFAWRPWRYSTPIAEGPLIKKYLEECADEEGITDHIRFKHKLVTAKWRSREQRWTLAVDATDDSGNTTRKYFRGKFLVLGTGYYDYDVPLQATIPGLDKFKGQVVHPQFWPKDFDYTDKNVAIIGSGATAITIVPAMAEKAKKVTMVQRSPGYVLAIPNRARKLPWWLRIVPEHWRNSVIRFQFLVLGFFYRRFLSGDGESTKKFLARATSASLPPHIPYDPHFKPNYLPWTQRMCFCPNGDFFKSLHAKKADVETGVIESVTEDGLTMENGNKVDADIIVTATGLNMKYGGNAEYFIDGEKLEFGSKYLWRGVMIQDAPNMAIVMGYTKASWTLGADATAQMVVRMIKHLTWNKYDSATPRLSTEEKTTFVNAPGIMGLTSTYILTALHRLPKTGSEAPWKARGNYLRDMWDARFSSVDKGMQYTKHTS